MGHFTQSTEENRISNSWKLNFLDYEATPFGEERIVSTHDLSLFRTLPFHFSTSESQSMNELSRQYNTNLFNFCYLGLIQTLAELTHKTDIAITTFFHTIDPSNQLPKLSPLLIQYKLSSKLSFCEQFIQSALATLKAYENRHSRLEALIPDLHSTELLEISLTVTDADDRNMLYLPCKETMPIPFPHHPKNANISLSLKYTDEGIQGEVAYNEACYRSDLVENLLANFQKTLKKNLQYFDK